MSFYRSDFVNHYNLVIPKESAWEIMNRLGQTKLVHIVPNLIPSTTKPYSQQVKRCQQNLIKLDALEKALSHKQPIEVNQTFSEQIYRQLYRVWQNELISQQRNPISMLDSFEQKVSKTWKDYFQLQQKIGHLKKQLNNYKDRLAIIRAGQKKFGRSFFTNSKQRIDQLGQTLIRGPCKVGFKTGIMSIKDQLQFKKTIFRIVKGNCFIQCVHFDDIFEHLSQDQQIKLVFFVLYPTQSQTYLQDKINKFVHMYCQQKYQLPSKNQQFDQFIKSCQDGYIQTQKLLTLTQGSMASFFQTLSSPSKQFKYLQYLQYIKAYLVKQREIYEKLNEFDPFNNFLKGSIYVRKQDTAALSQQFQIIQKNTKIPPGQLVQSQVTKFPTNFIVNDFTMSAQTIVQTYGVANYQQANPAFFTTLTFPFLFGVMFADMAHGSILLLFGLLLVFKKQQLNHFAFKLLIPHRYLLTLMGFFAIYCGLIYNDFMSVPIDFFGSCYTIPEVNLKPQTILTQKPNCVYPIGVDPVWSVSDNYLNFINSLKMKLSVILGVIHMILGILIKGSNAIYFVRIIQFFCQFIPQLIFMIVLFAYMDFLIIYKWLVRWGQDGQQIHQIQYAPSIITTMINIPLKFGKTDQSFPGAGGLPLWGTPGNTSQDEIQFIILIIAIICVPIMLLPKPLYDIYCKSKPHPSSGHSAEYKTLLSSENINQNINEKKSDIEKQHEEQEASQIFVHQFIETIQYVLGTVSNTASYLRLWALSLAHSQLSQVFFGATLQKGLGRGYSGIGSCIFGWLVLVGITIGVLLCMDSMECFLHTLRLHWVQFQNKFYKGTGFKFIYFNFDAKIKAAVQNNQSQL